MIYQYYQKMKKMKKKLYAKVMRTCFIHRTTQYDAVFHVTCFIVRRNIIFIPEF